MKELIEKIKKEIKKKIESYMDLQCDFEDHEMSYQEEILDNHYEGCKSGLETAIDIINKEAKSYNNGWIPCSERLPEERFFDDGYVEPSEAVLVLTKYNSYKVSRYWGNRRNKRDYHDWVDIEYRKNEVIAWKPIAPYQPKGE